MGRMTIENGNGSYRLPLSNGKTIRQEWQKEQNFVMSCFELTMDGNEAVLTDRNNDTLTLVYDSSSKTVYVEV